MDVCVVCGTVKAKGTNEDNQDKEKITENVQRENKVRTSGNKKKKYRQGRYFSRLQIMQTGPEAHQASSN
jgi:hypothetical protein